ncbi:MAG: EutN/CcmL family microcompartment protein [Bradymonadia bacterium]
MYLGKVIGTVVASVKYQGLEGVRLMIVESLDENKKMLGDPHVAVDHHFSGPGDVVFLVGSREAALACDPTFVPVDAAIVGFVDRVNHQGADT